LFTPLPRLRTTNYFLPLKKPFRKQPEIGPKNSTTIKVGQNDTTISIFIAHLLLVATSFSKLLSKNTVTDYKFKYTQDKFALLSLNLTFIFVLLPTK